MYTWHHGCGPTAAGMVIGFWDSRGFDDLVVGTAANQNVSVDAMIASADHYEDYSLPIDDVHTVLPDKSELGGAHASNCVADFMHTSWSIEDLPYGWTSLTTSVSAQYGLSWGMQAYTRQANASYHADAWSEDWRSDTLSAWTRFVDEIDAGFPIVLLVDSDGNGATDHFVTAVGYDDSGGTRRYACYNTWDTELHWYDFAAMSIGQSFGVAFGSFYRPLKDAPPTVEITSPDEGEVWWDSDCFPSNTVWATVYDDHTVIGEQPWVWFRLDGGDWVAGSNSGSNLNFWWQPPLNAESAEGYHTIEARATDCAGQHSEIVSVSILWQHDEPPGISIGNVTANGTVSSGDNYFTVFDNEVTVTGSAWDDRGVSEVTIYEPPPFDSHLVSKSPQVCTGSEWSFDLTLADRPGEATLEIRATDTKGNVTYQRLFICWDRPPEIVDLSLVDTLWPSMMSSSIGETTALPAARVDCDVRDPDGGLFLEFYGTLEVRVNDGQWQEVDGDPIHGPMPELPLEVGENTIEARATDSAGQTDTEQLTITRVDPVVDLPDPNLQAAVRSALAKPAGELRISDLCSLVVLSAPDQTPTDDSDDISDLTGLAHCYYLEQLDLSGHRIGSLAPLLVYAALGEWHSPLHLLDIDLGSNRIAAVADSWLGRGLADLPQLTSISLDHNWLTSISPLVSSSGPSDGDQLDVSCNRLDLSTGSAASTDVQSLRDKGVTVYCDGQQPTCSVTITNGPSGTPSPVESGSVAACSVTAEDSFEHALTYLWTAEGGAGSFNDATSRTPTWTAPVNNTGVAQDYEITVTVTCAEDASISDTSSYTQTVNPLPKKSLTIGWAGAGTVTVDGTPQTLPYTGNFAQDTVVTIDAIPNSNWRFQVWSGDVSTADKTNDPLSLTMDQDRSIQPHFMMIKRQLTVSWAGAGTVSINGTPRALPYTGMFPINSVVNIDALPGSGWEFQKWSGPAGPHDGSGPHYQTVLPAHQAHADHRLGWGRNGAREWDTTNTALHRQVPAEHRRHSGCAADCRLGIPAVVRRHTIRQQVG